MVSTPGSQLNPSHISDLSPVTQIGEHLYVLAQNVHVHPSKSRGLKVFRIKPLDDRAHCVKFTEHSTAHLTNFGKVRRDLPMLVQRLATKKRNFLQPRRELDKLEQVTSSISGS